VERAHLFATFAQAHALVKGYEPAQEALREELNIASQLSDPKLEARLLMLIQLFQHTTICWGLGLKRQVRKVQRIPDAVVRGRGA
jgi:hypothetical protein